MSLNFKEGFGNEKANFVGRFGGWIYSNNPQSYNFWGNGFAMRVSACGWIGKNLDEVKSMSHEVTVVTHNHPEGLRGAEAVAEFG